MKPLFPLAGMLLLAAGMAGAAEPDFPALTAGLASAHPQHPYLAFDTADKQRMLERIRSDPGLSELMEKVRLEGRSLLEATYEPPAPPREPHPRYVGSDDYLAYMEGQARDALILAFLYQATGKQAYAEKSFEHADRLCALDSWVQSPHRFDVIYPRVWPYGAKDDEVVFTYDITTAGITRDLSYVYDWLYPALTKAQRDRIRSGLLEKAITRVRGSYDYFWWANASRCNWSGICHSGLGLAALTLMDEDPGLNDVIARSCDGVWNLLEHVGPDGGWQEGRGYWAYGMGESVMFIDAIKRATGGKVDLFHHRAFYPHPADFALYGLTAGFGDGSGQPVGSSFMIHKLVAETGDGTAAWYAERYVRPMESVWDLIWPAPDVKPVAPTEASKRFSGIDWAVLRKDFGPDAMTVSCKAGLLDDPHHGHLDCGTFNLTWRGVNYLGEVPRSPYDEQYFGAERWDHEEARTEAHNVVLVNGEEQVCAKQKDQPWKEGVGGHIIAYRSDADTGEVEMDPTHAYPGESLKLWHRWILLDKTRNVTVILDRIGSAPGATIQLRFHPGVEFELQQNGAILHGSSLAAAAGDRSSKRGPSRRKGGTKGDQVERASGGGASTMHAFYAPDAGGRRGAPDLVLATAATAPVRMQAGREADLPVTEEPDFTWIPYFSENLQAQTGETVVASVFGTETAVGRPTVTAENGGWTVTYGDGQSHHFAEP